MRPSATGVPPRRSRRRSGPTRRTRTRSTTSSSLLRRIKVVGSREGAGGSSGVLRRLARRAPAPACRGRATDARLGLAARAVRPARVPARARAGRRRRARVQAAAARVAGARPRAVPGRRALRAAALPAVACLMLGIAVAQPAITTTTERSARTSSEVVFVTDVSRSMTAASAARSAHPARPGAVDRRGAPRVRARRAGRAQRPHRPRPALRLPDARRAASPRRSRGSVQAESPPPQAVSDVATSFEPLSSLSRDGFYKPGTEHRTCVLVTDGETRTATSRGAAAASSWSSGSGSAADRIYAANGKVDAAYRPESTAASTVDRLARAAGSVRVLRRRRRRRREALRRIADVGPSAPRRHGTVGPRARAVLRGARAASLLRWISCGAIFDLRVASHSFGGIERTPRLRSRGGLVEW